MGEKLSTSEALPASGMTRAAVAERRGRILALLRQGYAHADVAALVGVDEASVSRAASASGIGALRVTLTDAPGGYIVRGTSGTNEHAVRVRVRRALARARIEVVEPRSD